MSIFIWKPWKTEVKTPYLICSGIVLSGKVWILRAMSPTLEYSCTRDVWYLTVKSHFSNSKAVNPTGSCKTVCHSLWTWILYSVEKLVISCLFENSCLNQLKIFWKLNFLPKMCKWGSYAMAAARLQKVHDTGNQSRVWKVKPPIKF